MPDNDPITDSLVDTAMRKVPESWRYRWCENGPCACIGCANGSGAKYTHGMTKRQWHKWVGEYLADQLDGNWTPTLGG